MKRFWQISLAHVMLLMALVGTYLGIRNHGAPLYVVMLICCCFTAATTIAFVVVDACRSGCDRPPSWRVAIRAIFAGWLSGSLIVLDVAESLRRGYGYFSWSQDWHIFAGWVLLQLAIAMAAHGFCLGAGIAVRSFLLFRGNAS